MRTHNFHLGQNAVGNPLSITISLERNWAAHKPRMQNERSRESAVTETADAASLICYRYAHLNVHIFTAIGNGS